MTIDLEQFKGHTPGPWVAMPEDQGSVYGDPYCTIDDGTRSIAYVMLTDRARMKPLPEWRANAALMAASPALLSEVRRLKEALEPFANALLAHGDNSALPDEHSLLHAIREGAITITGVSLGDLRRAARVTS